MKSNTHNYAKQELDILLKTVQEPIIAPFVDEILILCDKFGKSGQSGGSAPFTASALSQAIKKLCLQEPICPITGIDEEWANVSEMNGGEAMFQNKRCSAVFKQSVNSQSYYVDAIIWKDESGAKYTGCAFLKDKTKLKSSQFIKTFPFTPKTFYIDVISKEIAPDDWEFYVKDEDQLAAVFNYYDKRII